MADTPVADTLFFFRYSRKFYYNAVKTMPRDVVGAYHDELRNAILQLVRERCEAGMSLAVFTCRVLDAQLQTCRNCRELSKFIFPISNPSLIE